MPPDNDGLDRPFKAPGVSSSLTVPLFTEVPFEVPRTPAHPQTRHPIPSYHPPGRKHTPSKGMEGNKLFVLLLLLLI